MNDRKYERKISAKVESRIADLAERLYNFMPNVCWMTELNLAAALNTNTLQVRNAKAYLLKTGRIKIEFRQNGKRKNPVHTLTKSSPINQNSSDVWSDEVNSSIDWSILNDIRINDLNYLSVEDHLELYEQMRLSFIPLHFPKFDKNGNAFCSCRYGRYCESIGKHPATAYKSLDFSSKQTFKAMKAYWEKDARYNIGFIVDGFTVIDVDFRHGGAYSLELLQETYGELPQNLTVKTGNGLHIYAKGNRRIKNGVGVLDFQGIDVRSKGSFIVAPFSDHFSGKQYEWLSISKPEKLPQGFVDDLTTSENQSNDSTTEGNRTIDTDSPLPNSIDTDYTIAKGARNTMLYRLASRERGKGAEQTEIFSYLQKINAKHCKQPLDERELSGISKSVMKFPPNSEKYRFARQNVANI